MKKNICIFGSVGINRGDDLMNRAIFNLFESLDCEIAVASIEPEFYAKQYNCVSFNSSVRNVFGWIKNIYRSDLVVVGGGTLIQEDFGKSNLSGILLYSALVVLVSRIMGKKVIALSLGVNKVFGLNRYISKLFQLTDLITVRDKLSVNNLVANDINVEARLVGDIALCRNLYDKSFSINYDIPTTEFMCVSLAKENLGDGVIVIGRRVIERAVSLGLKVVLVAMDVRDEEEISIYRVLQKEFSNAVTIVTPNNPFELIPLIRAAKLLVGMRLHFCVLCFTCDRKPVIISREGKTEWLKGMAENVLFFDIKNESIERFQSFIESINTGYSDLSLSEKSFIEAKIVDANDTYFEIAKRYI